MGQYYLIVNLDKREYLYPHRFGDGLKLTEFGCGSCGTMTALAILLADGNGRGFGDLEADDAIVGSWAGDRIVVAGDYADGGRFLEGVDRDELQAVADDVYTEGYREAEHVNLYHWAGEMFRDVSDLVIQAMLKDCELRETLTEVAQRHRTCWAGKDGPLAPSLKALVTT
jgi:hypothetical protein